MRVHRLTAVLLLVGTGALGAPAAEADQAPTATPGVTAASSAPPSASAGMTGSTTTPAPTATTTRSPARSPSSTSDLPSTPSASRTTAAPPAAAASSDPSAAIGAFDCEALSASVALDNSGSTTITTFQLTRLIGAAPISRREEEVPAGTTVETRVDLLDNAYNELLVSVVEGDTTLASKGPVFCGDKPRVTIGAFDCSALQAPVTLDNSTGATPFLFDVQWFFSNTDFDQYESYTVEAGAVRVVMVPLVDNAWTSISVREGFSFVALPPDQLVVTTRDLCGLEPGPARVTVSTVNCQAKTLGVTIDNRQTPPRRPRSTMFAVRTTYAGKVTFSRYLEGQDGYRLTVPVELRRDGRLTVTGAVLGATPPREVLYSETLDTTCGSPTSSVTPAPAAQPSSPGTPAATEQLSATGGSTLPALLLASLLAAAGIALIRLAGRPSRAGQRGGS